MSRKRMINPDFFVSEQVLSCSLVTRMLFIGMLCWSDDAGIHPVSYIKLKTEIFPADPYTIDDIKKSVSELIENKLVEEYEIKNVHYWRITGWSKHQSINKPNYKYPLNNQCSLHEKDGVCLHNKHYCCDDYRSTTVVLPEDYRSTTTQKKRKEEKGKEEKGKENKKRARGADVNFQKFWEAYPNKTSKGQAERTWQKIPDIPAVDELVTAIAAQTRERELKQKQGLFVPEWKHPSTWLNAKCWEDVLLDEQQIIAQAKQRERYPPDEKVDDDFIAKIKRETEERQRNASK